MSARRQNSRSFRVWIALQAILFSFIVSAGNSFPGRSIFSADDLFTEGLVSAVEINLSDQEVRSLREHPRREVNAVVRIGETEFRSAEVHLKGSGTFQPIAGKPSFTLKIEGLPGISKIHLN